MLAGFLALYYVRSVSESEIWRASEGSEDGETAASATPAVSPLRALMRGPSARAFAQVFTMMTGFWLTQNLVTLFLPTTVLRDVVGLSTTQLTVTLLIAYVCLVGSYIGGGVLGQRVGRRRFFVVSGITTAVVGSVLLALLVNTRGLPFGVIVLLVCAFSVVATAPWGVMLPYIAERFRTDVRASGLGLGLSASVVIPSFYAFFLAGLGTIMPYALTALVLLAVGGLLGSAGAAAGPETRDVDFSR